MAPYQDFSKIHLRNIYWAATEYTKHCGLLKEVWNLLSDLQALVDLSVLTLSCGTFPGDISADFSFLGQDSSWEQEFQLRDAGQE